jgi:glycyl-tRNA synthetase beta chain
MTAAFTPDTRSLLVELLTEELPPKALQKLGDAFAEGVRSKLDALGLLDAKSEMLAAATPRRLGVHFSAVHAQAPDQPYAERLMPVKVGLDASGQATPALQKKLAAKGWQDMSVAELARESDGKQDYLVARGTARGASLASGLQEAIDTALAGLPIPKMMRYQLDDGVTTVRFVRPAHGLVALFGADVVDVSTLGLAAGRTTLGHRFLASDPIVLEDADHYPERLLERGHVITSFVERRAEIDRQLQLEAGRLGVTLGDDPEVAALLDEVTALVELPTVYVGEFEERFLAVPQECLILTMRLNQRYFPLFDLSSGKLTHRFLIVSNMRTDDPVNIIGGNQRVIRPRLADAQFFFDTDRKTPLAARVPSLANIVYHNKLGSQLDRVERVRALARGIAQSLGADSNAADRAALLAKADLGSNMVGEFPELQGIMGAYYALGDGEPAVVVDALRGQYRNRLDAPVTSDTLISAILFIAERAETLVGIWSVGGAPTGERDPYGLRRAALGLISAFEQLGAGGILKIDQNGPLTLDGLLAQTQAAFGAGKIAPAVLAEVRSFVYERYRNLLNLEFERACVDAVIAVNPPLHQVAARTRAVAQFNRLPEAATLAAANKRIGNLLKKSDTADAATASNTVDLEKLVEPAECALVAAIAKLKPVADGYTAQGDFSAGLATLAQVREPVDAFFADVMVMADDPAVRANRLALLAELHAMMNQVADISRLAQ